MWFLLKAAMNILFCPSNLPKRENHLASSHKFCPLCNSVIGIKPPSVADTVHGDCPVAKVITLSNVVYKHILRIMKLSLFILHLIITWARGQQSYIIFESYLICHLSECWRHYVLSDISSRSWHWKCFLNDMKHASCTHWRFELHTVLFRMMYVDTTVIIIHTLLR